jgi:hypothetical protein
VFAQWDGVAGPTGVPVIIGPPHPLVLQQKALENQFLSALVDQARLQNRRTGLENKWIDTEVRALWRFYFQLSRDERESRHSRDRLRSQRAELLRFASRSGPSHLGVACLTTCLADVPLDAELREALQKELPACQPDDFAAPGTKLFQLVMADGRLSDPPSLLRTGGPDAEATAAMADFQQHWKEVCRCLGYGRPVPEKHLSELADALARHTAASSSILAKAKSPTAKYRARDYVSSMQLLVDVLNDPRRCARLERYLKTGGFRFHGGTVGELVRWMDENEVAPVFGSRPQMAVASLAEEFAKRIDARLAAVEAEIKSLKDQSPSREAATKERLVNEQRFLMGPGLDVPSLTTTPELNAR